MNYLVESPKPRYVPFEPNSAIIARYARGRDYHKVMRGRLKTLATRIREKWEILNPALLQTRHLFLRNH